GAAARPRRHRRGCRDGGAARGLARRGVPLRAGPLLLAAARGGRGAGVHRKGADRGKELGMKPTRTLGFQLLGIWLVAQGIIGLVPILLPGLGIVMSVVALVAGLLILIGRT